MMKELFCLVLVCASFNSIAQTTSDSDKRLDNWLEQENFTKAREEIAAEYSRSGYDREPRLRKVEDLEQAVTAYHSLDTTCGSLNDIQDVAQRFEKYRLSMVLTQGYLAALKRINVATEQRINQQNEADALMDRAEYDSAALIYEGLLLNCPASTDLQEKIVIARDLRAGKAAFDEHRWDTAYAYIAKHAEYNSTTRFYMAKVLLWSRRLRDYPVSYGYMTDAMRLNNHYAKDLSKRYQRKMQRLQNPKGFKLEALGGLMLPYHKPSTLFVEDTVSFPDIHAMGLSLFDQPLRYFLGARMHLFNGDKISNLFLEGRMLHLDYQISGNPNITKNTVLQADLGFNLHDARSNKKRDRLEPYRGIHFMMPLSVMYRYHMDKPAALPRHEIGLTWGLGTEIAFPRFSPMSVYLQRSFTLPIKQTTFEPQMSRGTRLHLNQWTLTVALSLW